MSDAIQLFLRFGTQHGYPLSRKLGMPLNKGLATQMATRAECPGARQTAGCCLPLLGATRSVATEPSRQLFAGFKVVLHFFEEPRTTEAGTPYHDGIHPVKVGNTLWPAGGW